MINQYSDEVKIQNYEIILNPFLLQMNISGTFEVLTTFEIPPQTLFAKISFPNQQISNVELIPNKQKRCHSNNSKCRTFEIKSSLILSQDKYFSREFTEYEKVPIRIDFEIKTMNWSAFKSINSLHDGNNSKYINFINQWKLINLENYFQYKNSFSIERNKHESQNKSIDAPIQWRMFKEKDPQTITEKIDFKIPNYSGMLHNPIRELFAITNAKNLEIIPHSQKISINSNQFLDLSSPIKKHTNNTVSFHLSEGLIKTDENTYKTNSIQNEILMFEKTEGFLKNKVLIRLKNNSFYVNIKNHYSFLGNGSLNPYLNPIIRIINKEDKYFQKLNQFKYIPI